MWTKKTLALLTAAAMAGSAIAPAAAQPYGNGYNSQYNSQYGPPPDDRYGAPPPNNSYGPPPPNGGYGPPPPNGGYGPPPPNGGYGPPPSDSAYGPPPPSDQDAPPPPPPGVSYNQGYDRGYADAQTRSPARFDRDAYYRDCEQQRSGNTAGGAIIGAIAGGLLGNAISRGPQRGAGTAVGAVLGGVVGAGIGSNLNCEERSYAVNTYYTGFEAGRPHARYEWRSPRSDAYGYLTVGDYYYDRGVRCATYSQRVFIHGRPEIERGFACRRPNGTWELRR